MLLGSPTRYHRMTHLSRLLADHIDSSSSRRSTHVTSLKPSKMVKRIHHIAVAICGSIGFTTEQNAAVVFTSGARVFACLCVFSTTDAFTEWTRVRNRYHCLMPPSCGFVTFNGSLASLNPVIAGDWHLYQRCSIRQTNTRRCRNTEPQQSNQRIS